jgi:hypothetical protein
VLAAAPEEVRAGMAFQAEVLSFLNSVPRDDVVSEWVETRALILRDHFGGRVECSLSRYELPELNLMESVRGDLTDWPNGVAMECQTAVSGLDASWEHSKRQRCEAEWQCFGFRTGRRLVVHTAAIRTYLDRWSVSPQQSRRDGGGPYYPLSEDFLGRIGGMDLALWRTGYRSQLRRTHVTE